MRELPAATAIALVVETFMKTELVKSAANGVPTIRVLIPNTGLTEAIMACAMLVGIFATAKVKPASTSDVRCFFSGMIVFIFFLDLV